MSEPADIKAARELLSILTGNQPSTTSLLVRAEPDLRALAADPNQQQPARAFVNSTGAVNLKPTQQSPQQNLAHLGRANLAPRCQHIKADGVRCGSPALKHKNFCHFHHQLRIPKRNPISYLPPLEDANGVQCAIMQVAHAVLHKQIDRLTANTLLYALQTAASNLKRVKFEPLLHKLVPSDTVKM
jgi:hypothetical protein